MGKKGGRPMLDVASHGQMEDSADQRMVITQFEFAVHTHKTGRIPPRLKQVFKRKVQTSACDRLDNYPGTLDSHL